MAAIAPLFSRSSNGQSAGAVSCGTFRPMAGGRRKPAAATVSPYDPTVAHVFSHPARRRRHPPVHADRRLPAQERLRSRHCAAR
ncbi:hypothetical protein BDI4_1040016 [Burkholderia diffusa]|nr:hypothetical protein BDI4_1040016 [Burkholderia diffusa]